MSGKKEWHGDSSISDSMLSDKSCEYAPADQDDIESVEQTPSSLRRLPIYTIFSNWIIKAALGVLLLVSMVFGILKIFHVASENSAGLLSPFSFFPDCMPSKVLSDVLC